MHLHNFLSKLYQFKWFTISPQLLSVQLCSSHTCEDTYPVYQVLQATLTNRLNYDHVVLTFEFEEVDIEYRAYIRMLQG